MSFCTSHAQSIRPTGNNPPHPTTIKIRHAWRLIDNINPESPHYHHVSRQLLDGFEHQKRHKPAPREYQMSPKKLEESIIDQPPQKRADCLLTNKTQSIDAYSQHL
jgi:hypothetical protein